MKEDEIVKTLRIYEFRGGGFVILTKTKFSINYLDSKTKVPYVVKKGTLKGAGKGVRF